MLRRLPEAGPAGELWFDASTALLARLHEMPGRPSLCRFDDHRPIDGIVLLLRVVSGGDQRFDRVTEFEAVTRDEPSPRSPKPGSRFGDKNVCDTPW